MKVGVFYYTTQHKKTLCQLVFSPILKNFKKGIDFWATLVYNLIMGYKSEVIK